MKKTLTLMALSAMIIAGCSKQANNVSKDIKPTIPDGTFIMSGALITSYSKGLATIDVYHYKINSSPFYGTTVITFTRDGIFGSNVPTLNALYFQSKVSEVDTTSVNYPGEILEVHVAVPNFELKPGTYNNIYDSGSLAVGAARVYVKTKGTRKNPYTGTTINEGLHEFKPDKWKEDYCNFKVTKVNTYPYSTGSIKGNYITIDGSFEIYLSPGDVSFVYTKIKLAGSFTGASVSGYD